MSLIIYTNNNKRMNNFHHLSILKHISIYDNLIKMFTFRYNNPEIEPFNFLRTYAFFMVVMGHTFYIYIRISHNF